MKVITVSNAKGGCGKSTIAMNLAACLGKQHQVLLIDMDPQAQATDWLRAGDGLTFEGSLAQAFMAEVTMAEIIVPTAIKGVSVAPSAQPLEELSRQMVEERHYECFLAKLLGELPAGQFDYAVIDSPNQISPLMENAIIPTELFVIPFESTKAVASYANFFQLIQQLRHPGSYRMLHVLNNLHLSGLRKRVIKRMQDEQIPIAINEIRNCGWLAQVDGNGGSIFDYRPKSKGAQDIPKLMVEALASLKNLKMEEVA